MKATIRNVDKWVLPVYHDCLRDYHTRINVLYGGAGSGKSYFVVQKMILKCLSNPNRKVLIVRKYGTTIKDSIWSLFVEELFSYFAQFVKRINRSDYTITMFNGSVFLFKGLDDNEKIKSINGITDIVIEEATEITLEDFTQLNLRLRSKQPFNQIHLMFNPISKVNWVYKYFFENEPPEDCKIYQTTFEDNRHLPKEYIDNLNHLKQTNPAYYNIYVQGEFATLDKLVFPVFSKKIITQEETQNCLFWIGLDFGYVNDPSALTWGYFNPTKKVIYITGEYNKKGMTNDEIANSITDLGFAKEKIIADCAEQKSIEEIKRMGINRIFPCSKGQDSIMNGIDKMLRCDIIIDERCQNVIEEFENYTWKKDRSTGEYYNEPCDCYNHHIDSIRYGLQPVIDKKVRTQEINPMFM